MAGLLIVGAGGHGKVVAETAAAMQVDPTKHWSTKPFATRLVSTEGFDRVTLTTHCLTFTGNGDSRSEPLTRSQWDDSLAEWFAMTRPGPWPESTST